MAAACASALQVPGLPPGRRHGQTEQPGPSHAEHAWLHTSLRLLREMVFRHQVRRRRRAKAAALAAAASAAAPVGLPADGTSSARAPSPPARYGDAASVGRSSGRTGGSAQPLTAEEWLLQLAGEHAAQLLAERAGADGGADLMATAVPGAAAARSGATSGGGAQPGASSGGAVAAAAGGALQHGNAQGGVGFGIRPRPMKTEICVRVTPVTVRASFSNVRLWAAMLAELSLCTQVRWWSLEGSKGVCCSTEGQPLDSDHRPCALQTLCRLDQHAHTPPGLPINPPRTRPLRHSRSSAAWACGRRIRTTCRRRSRCSARGCRTGRRRAACRASGAPRCASTCRQAQGSGGARSLWQ